MEPISRRMRVGHRAVLGRRCGKRGEVCRAQHLVDSMVEGTALLA
jgi:hypothetical protein